MTDAEFSFNGPPPPPSPRAAGPKSALRLACEANPGEWAQITPKNAAAMQQYWNRTAGFEATTRGDTVYVRYVSEGVKP